MGLLLNDAASQFLEMTSAPLGAGSIYPFSVSCFYNTDDAADAQQVLFSITDQATNADWVMLQRHGSGSGTPNEIEININSTEDGNKFALDDVGDTGAGVWNQAGCVCSSTTSAYAYLNGVPGAIDATNVEIGNLGTTQIGALALNAGNFYYVSGILAEVGVWNVALTTIEMAMLAAGYSPLFIRPASLVQYFPLKASWNNPAVTNYMDLITGLKVNTFAAGINAEHPRIIYPSSGRLIYEADIDYLSGSAKRRAINRGVGIGVFR